MKVWVSIHYHSLNPIGWIDGQTGHFDPGVYIEELNFDNIIN